MPAAPIPPGGGRFLLCVGSDLRYANRFAGGHRPPAPPSRPWRPDSWRERPASQQPVWPDESALEHALKHLGSVPPLVFAGEARALTAQLAEVAEGKAFLLQAGDCAESFDAFSADAIRDKLKVILQMAVVLTYSTGVPGIKVGRI